jgi:Beta-lactamase superfamily domain
MQNITTDQLNKENSRLNLRRMEAASGYPRLFTAMTADWNTPRPEDRVWLMYSANYFFHTAGARWALDPLTLHRRVPETPKVDMRHAFDQLEFVLLTHRHADHLDLDLLGSLRHLPIRWIIPEFLLPEVQAGVGLPANQIITPRPFQPIDICGIHILPFEGLHWEKSPAVQSEPHGMPAMGYGVRFNGKSWLFPGDTRNYRPDRLTWLGRVDGMFAHLWLGRGCALMDEPPLLDEFCRFCSYPQPKRVVLTHLEEFGRKAEDFWEERHTRRVIARLGQIAPEISVSVAHMGGSFIL